MGPIVPSPSCFILSPRTWMASALHSRFCSGTALLSEWWSLSKKSRFRDADALRHPELLTLSHRRASFILRDGCWHPKSIWMWCFFLMRILWQVLPSRIIRMELLLLFSEKKNESAFLLLCYYLDCSHSYRSHLCLGLIALGILHPKWKSKVWEWLNTQASYIPFLKSICKSRIQSCYGENRNWGIHLCKINQFQWHFLLSPIFTPIHLDQSKPPQLLHAPANVSLFRYAKAGHSLGLPDSEES